MVSELELNAIAEDVVERLRRIGVTLVTAESSTGGMIASTIVSISGASDVFDHGFVTYSNQSKMDLLHVREDVLEAYGAVSDQIAQEMSKGAIHGVKTDCMGVAVTGIAGPDGGTDDKPVGTVFISVALKKDNTVIKNTEHYVFAGDRTSVRMQSCAAAMRMILDMI